MLQKQRGIIGEIGEIGEIFAEGLELTVLYMVKIEILIHDSIRSTCAPRIVLKDRDTLIEQS